MNNHLDGSTRHSNKSISQLFQPIALGPIVLKHRVVLAPLTRRKVDSNHVPFLPLVKEYYTQRGSAPGTLLIAESTIIAATAGGYPIPGIWSQGQIKAWKEVVESVHAKGSFIYLKLCALGRGALRPVLKAQDPTFDLKPRPLTVPEIQEYVGFYAQAAKNATEAGFDGVEIHDAIGRAEVNRG
ncbi:hypothetical protein DFH07DRAFT_985390 [Mycena maculata]|uniref:NADH:flavin oxidoreductase/NADH oxidase N-terminal domain-containing protein n=1 Tax=Mycena maculata TaxID=230809 RepID=A0AAD7I932_9AGAR|nr:hypothetical protein DFH07DRAFT_985390 [Mycena maculata]